MPRKPQKKSSSSDSILGKVAIGVIGVIGGVLLGTMLSQNDKKKTTNKSPNKQFENKTSITKGVDYQSDNIEELMECPISHCVMKKPVIVIQCGHTFEKEEIQKWVAKNRNCPLCKVAVGMDSLKPNYQLQQVINGYQQKKQMQQS